MQAANIISASFVTSWLMALVLTVNIVKGYHFHKHSNKILHLHLLHLYCILFPPGVYMFSLAVNVL